MCQYQNAGLDSSVGILFATLKACYDAPSTKFCEGPQIGALQIQVSAIFKGPNAYRAEFRSFHVNRNRLRWIPLIEVVRTRGNSRIDSFSQKSPFLKD
jgi:hypothetical protein